MPFFPAIFEFISTTEVLIIAVVALIIFGPRRLPEIGRTVGKTLAEFKRTSEDFKRTWEREVEFERLEKELRMPDINVEARDVTPPSASSATRALADAGSETSTGPWAESEQAVAPAVESSTVAEEPAETPQKHEWL